MGRERQRDEWVEVMQGYEMHSGSRGTQLIYIRLHQVQAERERRKRRKRRIENRYL